jgi:hypothetical protein
VLARVGPGETLGEISLFDKGPAAATVIAVEFSQLWRIADSDLMQFMEDNPGAGNVLLRTLASILAQRLRQMNPKAYGLSTYAVVDSPDLAKSSPPLDATQVLPGPDETPVEEPVEVPTTYGGKKLSTKTQVVPNPDDLEPL